MARPTKYNKEIAERICYLVQTEARGIKYLCDNNNDIPSFKTVFNWLQTYPEFLQQYTRAREEQSDALADKIIEVAFDKSKNLTEAQDKRTQIDALKWIASKLKPKKYGDKLDVQQDVKVTHVQANFGNPIQPPSQSEENT